MKVRTVKGDIERSSLTVKDVIEEDDLARVVATEWYLNGEMVRRDVWINVLRPLELGVDHV